VTADATLRVVRAYHHGWSSRHFDQAIGLLAAELEVEVPINSYPTTESFAQALVGFAGMVSSVDLLAEMSAGDEAMLLYDLDVQQLGKLRVAEHFTVADAKITRIRQVHDTAALRAAGFERARPRRRRPAVQQPRSDPPEETRCASSR
jgi:hypothetical protein